MKIPKKIAVDEKINARELKRTINELVDAVKSNQLTGDGITVRVNNTPSGTTLSVIPQEIKAVSSASGGASTPAYDGGFNIVDISTYNSETGAFTGEIIVTLESAYVAPKPDAEPPVAESYSDYAGYMYINAMFTPIASTKFSVTASKSVVVYSGISDTSPFIGTPTIALIDDIEEDLPENNVFIWLGDVKFNAQEGTFGNEGFKRASLTVTQIWEDGYYAYLPAFRDGNIT